MSGQQLPANYDELKRLFDGFKTQLEVRILDIRRDLDLIENLLTILDTARTSLGANVEWHTFATFMMSQIAPIQERWTPIPAISVASSVPLADQVSSAQQVKKQKKKKDQAEKKRYYVTAMGYAIVSRSLGKRASSYPLTFEEAAVSALGSLESQLPMTKTDNMPLVWQDLVLGSESRLWVNTKQTMEIILKLYDLYGRDNSGLYPESTGQTAALHRKLAYYHDKEAIARFLESWQQSIPETVERLLRDYEFDLETVPFPQRMRMTKPRWAVPK